MIQQIDRRNAILRILRSGVVRRQTDLAQLLKRDGFEITQSSVSRDLRELGVLKAGGRYLVPPDEISRANGDFDTAAVIAGEVVDLITDIPPASEIGQRMVAEAAGLLSGASNRYRWSNNGSSPVKKMNVDTRRDHFLVRT